jgi:hypothetical protein
MIDGLISLHDGERGYAGDAHGSGKTACIVMRPGRDPAGAR